MRPWRISLLALAALAAAPAAGAGLYGADRCASDKLRAAARVCGAVLEAHARYERDQDAGRLDAALGKARGKLAKAWARAEKRVAKELDCSETTATDAEVAALLEEAAAALAADVNDGLDLGVRGDAACGADLLGASALACEGILRAWGQHVRKKGEDRLRLRLGADRAEVQAELAEAAAAARATCASRATPQALADGLSGLAEDVLEATTVSPAVEGPGLGWIQVIPEEEVRYQGRKLRPICLYGTPYKFFARRGTVNKLVVYYQGGGACWNYATCKLPACDPTVTVGDLLTSGLSDLHNPANPFRDWSWVVVPYCTGDAHFGDAQATYAAPGLAPLVIEHRGFENARVVEKWARDHFVLPEQVFVAGTSAGGLPAFANGAYLMESVWPSSHFDVLSDANSGVITQDFLENSLANWSLEQNIPGWIPALDRPLTELDAADLWVSSARQYPANRFATYTTAYDGGGGSAQGGIPGQTAGYNIMLNGGDPFAALAWWEASCAWHDAMRAANQTIYARAPTNFRYYVGAGSTHGMWYWSDKVYEETTSDVPTVVDWVNAMLAGSPDWVNVECQDCGVTLPGDPVPPTLPTPPFDENGNIVCDTP
jgi:hypothetical protein